MDENRSVPYIVYESAMVRAERTIRRLVTMAIIAIVLMFISNFAWMYEWSKFDTISYEQDGEGVNNVNLGTQGDVLNGAEGQSESKEEAERQ